MIQRGIKHVVCAISGGVDSAVAAMLIKSKGHHVTGAFMRNWDVQDESGQCSLDQALEDANYVCRHLDIELHEVSFVKEYWNNVFSAMIKDYELGHTPNPDVLCNKYIKFDAFHDYALNRLGADFVATGHYARTSGPDELAERDVTKGVRLLRALDRRKDQTFFLAQVNQQALRRTTFPIGDMRKDLVKKIAASSGMERIAKKKESYGICFIGKRDFHSFIDEYIEEKRGNFVDIENGQTLGEHTGVHRYTIGQCIRVGGLKQPYFVAARNPQNQDILVAAGTNHPALFSESFVADSPHWIYATPLELIKDRLIHGQFKYQHSHPETGCTVRPSENRSYLLVDSARYLRALAVGQFAVFYQGDTCLGSACIRHTGDSLYHTTGRTQQMDNPLEFS